MLKLNKFYWNLYKDSPEGISVIKQFRNLAEMDFNPSVVLDIIRDYDPEYLNLNPMGMLEYFDAIFNDIKDDANRIKDISIQDMKKLVESFIIRYEDYCLDNIVPLSFVLYITRPDYFIPYLFLFRYRYLEQIADNLDLDFGEVPGPNDKAKRCLYYLSICEELYKYRTYNGLSGAELCALMYDMERKSYDSEFPKVLERWMETRSSKMLLIKESHMRADSIQN